MADKVTPSKADMQRVEARPGTAGRRASEFQANKGGKRGDDTPGIAGRYAEHSRPSQTLEAGRRPGDGRPGRSRQAGKERLVQDRQARPDKQGGRRRETIPEKSGRTERRRYTTQAGR
jgi:hypothetical protein